MLQDTRQIHIGSFGVSVRWGPGKIEDIAGAMAFLASSEFDYITGQALNIRGDVLVVH